MNDTNSEPLRNRRRGAWHDRRTLPLPTLADPISDRRVAAGRLAVVATVVAWVAYAIAWVTVEFINGGAVTTKGKVEAFIYLIVVTMLDASSLAYLVSRLGYFYRIREHRRVPRAVIDEFFSHWMPTGTVIGPSYREEERVIRATLLSAALQEYPYLRIALLIDDPPDPSGEHERLMLDVARRIPGEIEQLLSVPSGRFGESLERFEHSLNGSSPAIPDMMNLAREYDYAVSWLNELASATPVVDNADDFFVEYVVQGLAADLAVTAAAIKAAANEGVILPTERMRQLHRRLAWTFRASITSFERKQYVNLSHEPNKAMNLNSYIGLMGSGYRDVETVAGRVIVPAIHARRDIDIPSPDFVLTLDADSVLLPEYCLRLVYLMEQSQHSRVAVAQTPYSAYPAAGSRLERIAGATTDIQHIVHQGLTHYGATFWVGANAVLRMRALDDLKETSYVGNWAIHRYIRDRTVIEDTESTIDLGIHGWELLNYPERLSYSATPPDFGALCIQRRRWANGGLIILPKLRRQTRARRERGERARFGEVFLRANYMASIAWSSVALLLLLLYPFNDSLLLPLLVLVPLPYFTAMASDLKACGYQWSDIARVYGLNLILVPVNLAGVGNSVVQTLVGDKSVFGRTPKVKERTIPNLMFIVSPYLLLGAAAFTLWRDYFTLRWENGIYALINVSLVGFAIVRYIGLRNSLVDIGHQLLARLYRPEKPIRRAQPKPAVLAANPPAFNWAAVLHFGSVDGPLHSRPGLAPPSSVESSTAAASHIDNLDRLGQGSTETQSFYWAGREVDFNTVFQAVVDLERRAIIGYEALSRFNDGTAPNRWLVEASSHNSGVELETLLVQSAVRASASLPHRVWMALNVSVELVCTGVLRSLVERVTHQVVIEVESRDLSATSTIAQFMAGVPENVQVSLAGMTPDVAAMTLLDRVRPRYAKIDAGWLSSATWDRDLRESLRQLVSTCERMGCTLIAQGIETEVDLKLAEGIGVNAGQGYLLGRPVEFVAS